jgi:hypothetical protein
LRANTPQIDFKAPQGAWGYSALGSPCRRGLEARNAPFRDLTGVGKEVTFNDKPAASI